MDVGAWLALLTPTSGTEEAEGLHAGIPGHASVDRVLNGAEVCRVSSSGTQIVGTPKCCAKDKQDNCIELPESNCLLRAWFAGSSSHLMLFVLQDESLQPLPYFFLGDHPVDFAT